jgi:polyphosphate kinase 2 (PPK2 family)
MGSGIRTDAYKVAEGEKVNLGRWPPGVAAGFHGSEAQALVESRKLTLDLERLQEMLYAEHKHKLLVILQAMDTGGKDGTIKKVFEGVNPQGVRVAHFRALPRRRRATTSCGELTGIRPRAARSSSSTGATTRTCS